MKIWGKMASAIGSPVVPTRFAAARTILLILLAVLTRFQTFGDRNWFADDLLFFAIGQRIHDGALLYFDIWDRKPPGLFLIYYLVSGVSRSVWAYQLAGTFCAAATAESIARIVDRFASRFGAFLAGALYLCIMVSVGGRGGQAAVFFNLPVAIAALMLLRALPSLTTGRCPPSVYGAMLLAGFALTCKQTSAFEGIFFGLYTLWRLDRAGMGLLPLSRIAAGLILTGALPMLVFAAAFAASGSFEIFWRTIVTANIARVYNPGGDLLLRLLAFVELLIPAVVMALAGLRLAPKSGAERGFAIGWLAAALIGFFAVPNMIDHYALPLLVPLCMAMGPFLARLPLGPALGALYAEIVLIGTGTFDFDKARRDNEKLDALVAIVRMADPQPRLFVFDGPVYLYVLLRSWPPTPLVFPFHLIARAEVDVSPYSTLDEVRKVLAWRPTTVVFRQRGKDDEHFNLETTAAVRDYVAGCSERRVAPLSDSYGDSLLDVYIGCARGAAR